MPEITENISPVHLTGKNCRHHIGVNCRQPPRLTEQQILSTSTDAQPLLQSASRGPQAPRCDLAGRAGDVCVGCREAATARIDCHCFWQENANRIVRYLQTSIFSQPAVWRGKLTRRASTPDITSSSPARWGQEGGTALVMLRVLESEPREARGQRCSGTCPGAAPLPGRPTV
jgi:hypothetical protein